MGRFLAFLLTFVVGGIIGFAVGGFGGAAAGSYIGACKVIDSSVASGAMTQEEANATIKRWLVDPRGHSRASRRRRARASNRADAR
jgi:hypothetical protein